MGLGQWLLRAVYGAGGLAGVAIALLYFFQDKLLYVPKIPGVPDTYSVPPERYGLESEDITLTTKDGIKLHGWLLGLSRWSPAHRQSRPVILFFQENAGNMSFRLPFLRLMIHRLGCPVFAVSYRGYGLSQGRPHQAGMQVDAEAAVSYLDSRQDLNSGAIVVYGRSLGGAVAIHLAAQYPEKVQGLMIENTFMSVEEMVARVIPPLGLVIGPGRPLNFLVSDKWHNREELPKIKSVPILMIVSELDEMVPASQMYALHKLSRAPTTLVTIRNAHHMDAYDVDPEAYWSALRNFLSVQVEERLGILPSH